MMWPQAARGRGRIRVAGFSHLTIGLGFPTLGVEVASGLEKTFWNCRGVARVEDRTSWVEVQL